MHEPTFRDERPWVPKGAIMCQAHLVRHGESSRCKSISKFTLTEGKSKYLLCDMHAKIIGYQADRMRVRKSQRYRRVTVKTREADQYQQRIDALEASNERLTRLNEELIASNRRILAGEHRKRPQSPEDEGFIYILRVGGCYKIGWTSDLTRRMKQYHPDTTLMCVYPGTRAEEKVLHKRWAHYLRNGREWFMLAPEIDRHIEQMIAKHGEPEKVDFSAKLRAA